jgi:hypothetical protein
MTTIAILPEPAATGMTYRAVAGSAQSVGTTPGEALDALTAKLKADETGTLVVVQQLRPDRFFGAAQQQRLAELMARWRSARDAGAPWSAAEQSELDALVQAELKAAAQRAESLVKQLAP